MSEIKETLTYTTDNCIFFYNHQGIIGQCLLQLKMDLAYNLGNFPTGMQPREIIAHAHKETCIKILAAASHNSKLRNNPNAQQQEKE